MNEITDFDFLIGEWDVRNRRLTRRWVDSDEWEEFPGVSRLETRMSGVVNIDEITFPTKGFSGLTVRSFDREQETWSIYWINSAEGRVYPPVVGAFDGDTGTFCGEDEDEGKPIRVCFTWDKRDPDHPRWQQAFSRDGETWETNWIMELSRR